MTEEQAKTIVDFILTEIENEMAATRRVIAAVPAEQSSYKPSEKCMDGLALATHIVAAETFFLRGVVDGAFEWKQPDFKTPAEALAAYDSEVPALIAQIRALPAEKLLMPIPCGPWSDSAVMYLTLDLKHGVHHRGQLSAYLRPMGSKVPEIYGPSGDTESNAAAN